MFEIDIGGIPIGYREQISNTPMLREILETAWDVISDCTVGDNWMHD